MTNSPFSLFPPPPSMPPVRVVFESSAKGMNIEALAPCALVVVPSPDEPGIYQLYEQHGPPAELAQMCEIILRFAIANGLSDLVFRGLTAGATQASAITRDIRPDEFRRGGG